MKESDQILLSAGESIEYARQYIQQQGDLIRLEAAERLSKTAAALITAMAIAFLAMLVAVMLSLAVAFWLGRLWGSYPQAFLAITALYLVIGAVAYLFKKQLVTNPVLDYILNAFLTEDDKNG